MPCPTEQVYREMFIKLLITKEQLHPQPPELLLNLNYSSSNK